MADLSEEVIEEEERSEGKKNHWSEDANGRESIVHHQTEKVGIAVEI